MSKAITCGLLLVGLINFLPVIGVLSAQKIEAAYGLAAMGSDLEILLRHRALLFGIIGGFVIYAAFVPQFQIVAMVMAAFSMVGFLLLAALVGEHNAAIHKVFLADVIGVVILLVASVLKFIESGG